MSWRYHWNCQHMWNERFCQTPSTRALKVVSTLLNQQGWDGKNVLHQKKCCENDTEYHCWTFNWVQSIIAEANIQGHFLLLITAMVQQNILEYRGPIQRKNEKTKRTARETSNCWNNIRKEEMKLLAGRNFLISGMQQVQTRFFCGIKFQKSCCHNQAASLYKMRKLLQTI